MSRLKTGTLSSSGASQKPVVATMVYSVALRSTTRRPSHSQANSITATPNHSSTEDNTRPWPNRSQDRCSDSSSGSCSRVLPAPEAAGGDQHRAEAAQQRGPAPPRRWLNVLQPRNVAGQGAGWLGRRCRGGGHRVIAQADRFEANLASSARPDLGGRVDRRRGEHVQRAPGQQRRYGPRRRPAHRPTR